MGLPQKASLNMNLSRLNLKHELEGLVGALVLNLFYSSVAVVIDAIF